MLKVLQYFKEWKENKIKNEKRSTVKHKEVGNIEKNIFVVFDSISKIKWKRKKNSWVLTTNGSNNHANLLVIVASHVSLAITSL